MQKEFIIESIKAVIPTAKIELNSDDNVHFFLSVWAHEFQGKSKIEQHRMIYSAVGEAVGREIHALSINTFVLDESKK
jgi:stress-induced morphogen